MPRRKFLQILLLVIVIATAAAGVWRFQTLQAARRTSRSQPATRSVTVRVGEIAETISALGNLEPVTRLEIKAEMGGKVREILANRGDAVKKGQVILKLDTGELELKLKQAEASYLSAKANLNKLLATPSEAELAQAEATYEEAQVSFETAKAQFESDSSLYRAGAISQQQLQESRDRLRVNEQKLIAARERLEELKKGSRKEDLDIARAQLAQAEANLASIRNEINSATIRSPIDGTITEIQTQMGDIINPGTTLAIVADLSLMKAVVPINEIDAPRIKKGQEALISFDALPGKTFRGEVVSLAYEGKIRDNIVTYEATAHIPNPDGSLMAGMTADVKIILRSKQNALVVPLEALRETGRGTMVFVPGDEGQPVPRRVTVGLRNDTLAEVTEGLSEGDTVLVATGELSPPGNANRSQGERSRMPGGLMPGMNMRLVPRGGGS